MTSFTVAERNTLYLQGTVKDEKGQAFQPSTLTLYLYDRFTDTVINSRNRQDILNANGGTCDASGVWSLTLTPTDNTFVTAGKKSEKHIALIEWTWDDNQGNPAYGSKTLEIVIEDTAHVP